MTVRTRGFANAARTRRDDPEHRVHVRAVAELRASFVRRGVWSGEKTDACPLAHAANESALPVQYRVKLGDLGLAPGFPDLVIATHVGYTEGSHGWPGAALEIKAPGEKPTAKQLQWLAFWRACGFATAVTAGHRETALQLAAWGLIERAAADAWIAWAERCDPGAL